MNKLIFKLMLVYVVYNKYYSSLSLTLLIFNSYLCVYYIF